MTIIYMVSVDSEYAGMLEISTWFQDWIEPAALFDGGDEGRAHFQIHARDDERFTRLMDSIPTVEYEMYCTNDWNEWNAEQWELDQEMREGAE